MIAKNRPFLIFLLLIINDRFSLLFASNLRVAVFEKTLIHRWFNSTPFDGDQFATSVLFIPLTPRLSTICWGYYVNTDYCQRFASKADVISYWHYLLAIASLYPVVLQMSASGAKLIVSLSQNFALEGVKISMHYMKI
jgi:hypothetical protein